jgi:general secretion pathway protein D
MRLMQQLLAIVLARPLLGQAVPHMPGTPPVPPSPTSPGGSQAVPQQAAPPQQNQQQPSAAQSAPGQPAPTPTTQPAQPMTPLSSSQPFLLAGASLTEMIDVIAKLLKINYILDPRVQGKVTIYTYGEVKAVDLMPLLETLLRVNGATIVKVGGIHRIVRSPPCRLRWPVMNMTRKLPDDERMIST